MSGRLVVVGTPIGNIEDMSPRAVAALVAADVIACEDTRRTGRLLTMLSVGKTPMVVANDHTEGAAAVRLVGQARDGAMVALVSDAGMPAVSDPGHEIVAAFAAAELPIEVIPGPTAAMTAIAGSGLPSGRFVFEGFLPRKGSGRSSRVAEIADEQRTTVLYEAPHRVDRTIHDLRGVCGDARRVAVARELTKLHEEWFRGTLAAAAEWLADEPRGEFVLVLDGAPPPEPATDDDIIEAIAAARNRGASTKDAVAEVVDRLGVAKRRAYDLANG